MFRRFMPSCLALLSLPFLHCASSQADSGELDNAVIQRNGKSGTEIFAEENGTVTRYVCPRASIAALPPSASLSNPSVVKANCKQNGSLDIDTFRAQWKAAYIEYENFVILDVKDATGDLNEQEVIAFNELVRDLGWSFSEASAAPLPHEDTALRHARSTFLNVLDTVFDRAIPAKATSGSSTTKETNAQSSPSISSRLTASNVDIGTASMSGALSAKPETLVVALQAASAPIDALIVSASNDCATIDSVKATPASGTVTLGAARADATKWTLEGAATAVLSVTVSATQTVAGPCTITVAGNLPEAAPVVVTRDPRDAKMVDLMGRRDHRSWHYLWHGIRNGWLRMTPEQRDRVNKMGPSWSRAQEPEKQPSAARGEEFLHMHRAMLAMLKDHLGGDMYEPWQVPPAPTDEAFPVPPDNDDADAYQRLVDWDKEAKDPAFMKGKPLSEYGEWLESTLHNNMHMRWADWRVGSKFQRSEPTNVFTPGKPDADAPENNYLGSTYASHVNPVFYRLHGYVNNRIEDWLAANGYETIGDGEACVAPTCYKWQGVWDGAFPHPIASDPTVSTKPSPGPTPEALKGIAEDKSLVRLIHNNSKMVSVEETPRQTK